MDTYRPPPTYSAPGLHTEAGGCTFPGHRPSRTAGHTSLHAEHRPVARQPAATPAARAISATPAPEYSKNPKKAVPTPLQVKINR